MALVALVVVAGAVGAAALAAPALVRKRASERAATYGATIEISRVRPSSAGVRLVGVKLAFEDAPGLGVQLDEIVVDAGPLSGVRAVAVHGGRVTATGTRQALSEAVAKIAARRPARTGGAKAATPVSVDGLAATWSSPEGELSAEGLALQRGGAEIEATVGALSWSEGARRVSARRARVTLARGDAGHRVKLVRADEVEVEVADAAPQEPAPRPETAREPLSSRVQALRARATTIAAALGAALADGASVKVERASATVKRGGDTLHVGPGALALELAAAETTVSFQSPRADAGALPLSLSIKLPRDVTAPLALDVAGGPVPLSSLGVREGDLGLSDVARATLEASAKIRLLPDGVEVHAQSRGRLRALSITHPKLAKEKVRGLELGFAYDGALRLDGSYLRVDRGELDVGTVHAEGTGEITRTERATRVVLRGGVPLASCQGALDALPPGLAPHVAGMKMTGTFAVKGAVDFSSEAPDKAKIELSLVDECKVTQAPEAIDVERFRRPFRRLVYAPDGKRVEVETGPGTPGWVPYAGISPFMEAAVLTCEDGRFHAHKGFDVEAIRNSIRENLKAGRFVRGASTISMQTAKNLYLERDKTLGRKLEEAILTSYLEQALSKPQILELYLNVIEYGPMVYGVGPASAHYFRTGASSLSLGQALYLASILPNPKAQHFAAGGRVSGPWMGYLHRLMRGMPKRGVISEADAQDGLDEWVVFGQSRPERTKGDGAAEEPAPPPVFEP